MGKENKRKKRSRNHYSDSSSSSSDIDDSYRHVHRHRSKAHKRENKKRSRSFSSSSDCDVQRKYTRKREYKKVRDVPKQYQRGEYPKRSSNESCYGEQKTRIQDRPRDRYPFNHDASREELIDDSDVTLGSLRGAPVLVARGSVPVYEGDLRNTHVDPICDRRSHTEIRRNNHSNSFINSSPVFTSSPVRDEHTHYTHISTNSADFGRLIQTSPVHKRSGREPQYLNNIHGVHKDDGKYNSDLSAHNENIRCRQTTPVPGHTPVCQCGQEHNFTSEHGVHSGDTSYYTNVRQHYEYYSLKQTSPVARQSVRTEEHKLSRQHGVYEGDNQYFSGVRKHNENPSFRQSFPIPSNFGSDDHNLSSENYRQQHDRMYDTEVRSIGVHIGHRSHPDVKADLGFSTSSEFPITSQTPYLDENSEAQKYRENSRQTVSTSNPIQSRRNLNNDPGYECVTAITGGYENSWNEGNKKFGPTTSSALQYSNQDPFLDKSTEYRKRDEKSKFRQTVSRNPVQSQADWNINSGYEICHTDSSSFENSAGIEHGLLHKQVTDTQSSQVQRPSSVHRHDKASDVEESPKQATHVVNSPNYESRTFPNDAMSSNSKIGKQKSDNNVKAQVTSHQHMSRASQLGTFRHLNSKLPAETSYKEEITALSDKDDGEKSHEIDAIDPACSFTTNSPENHSEDESTEMFPDNNVKENAVKDVPVTCPYCEVILPNIAELKGHLDEFHVPKDNPCHLCDFTTTDQQKFADHIVRVHQSAQISSDSDPIRVHPLVEAFKETNTLSWYKFSKLLKNENMMEVEVPGNGFCFISSILVGLAEQGINKDYNVLSIDIMNEIKRYHSTMLEEGSGLGKPEEFTQVCASFFERGNYTHEYVDVCIGSAANALGINLYIFQKSGNYVSKLDHDCQKFKSKVSVYLLYYNRKNCKKNTECHYNPLLNMEYYKGNEHAVKSRMVVTQRDDENEQLMIDIALAQKLSREETSFAVTRRQKGNNTSTTHTPAKEIQSDVNHDSSSAHIETSKGTQSEDNQNTRYDF